MKYPVSRIPPLIATKDKNSAKVRSPDQNTSVLHFNNAPEVERMTKQNPIVSRRRKETNRLKTGANLHNGFPLKANKQQPTIPMEEKKMAPTLLLLLNKNNTCLMNSQRSKVCLGVVKLETNQTNIRFMGTFCLQNQFLRKTF